jgi:hypothetical protein
MKKIIILLFVLVLNLNCSSDASAPVVACTPIPCLNNGISNANCGCDCPEGYTGTNCSTQMLPTIIKITNIKVKYFPNSDNGNYWDVSVPVAANASPDIYVTLENSNNIELFNSPTYFENVLSDGTSTWNFTPSTPISVSFIYFNSLKIKLYDFDGAVSNFNDGIDDVMSSSSFNIYSATSGFPTKVTLLDSSTPIGYELTLQYIW